LCVDWSQAVFIGRPGNDAGAQSKKETKMLRKLLGAAAMAATVYGFVPAQAAHVHTAHVGVGCSGDNFAKAEGGVETMADGPSKFVAEREIAEAQDAMLSGKMGGCAMHLGRAMRAETQPAYPGMMGPTPFANMEAQPMATTPSQPQGNWAPTKGAY
jgi:hypothetical protein